jgi:choloylglycine hydrolase
MGVITNAPTYDWHILNQTNYLNLSTNPTKPGDFGSYTIKSFGGGSGLVGLPGDFSSPSRFVRAATFTATCRPLSNSTEAVFEAFRILDNFNIPLGAQLPGEKIPENMTSVTQITSTSDLKEKVYYYHTMWNREVRKIDLKKIDFSTIEETKIQDNPEKKNLIKDVTPGAN